TLRTKIISVKQKDLARKEATVFVASLKSLKQTNSESIQKSISTLLSKKKASKKTIRNLPSSNEQPQPRALQAIARRESLTVPFINKLVRLSSKRLFTNISTQGVSRDRISVGILLKEIPEGFKPLSDPDVKASIYESLNNDDAKAAASRAAVEIKANIEKAIDSKDAKVLSMLLGKKKFNNAITQKFKVLNSELQPLFSNISAANTVTSSPQGDNTQIVYIEEITEVSTADLDKNKKTHEEAYLLKAKNDKVSNFWSDVKKSSDIKPKKSTDGES
ncbi:MAG: hypothetical protein HRT88_15910, partial [Lentisphaeraceae bacterium]|nr:hypothetical protein [Lentisphaeraceae bacterium]